MECPKCESSMEEKTVSTLMGRVTVDRCVDCSGIWFDTGEAEALKEKWMAEHVDSGDRRVARVYDEKRDIDCPRCREEGVQSRMEKLRDPLQKHIRFEACALHGRFFDAGEFADYKNETLLDVFRDLPYLFRK